ncbi:MBOAT family O-acyltransferase [Adhaeribacter pallidiroseus]|uniref:Peptidoglycan O-acetyltransferase n=1 Tax=Adhaeribacter pallidiroseus TaxID=2072847 RepID=A0A369QL03_9BACT|nr:MBOAT family O-acyltransferase [Adhaeribacter pallidiroseus]RDC65404.1 Peptidoglycan O-acetyltransferase [Adhaeribacter pallidiroseus]
MLFNSYDFLVFFTVVLTLYHLLPSKFRWFMVLIASLYFYMSWKWQYIFIMFFPATIDFFVAKGLEKTADIKRKKLLLSISLITNLGLLFYFKYYNFFIDSINSSVSLFGSSFSLPLANILLPIGISFYTFQSISYTVEVYYGRQKAVQNFFRFSLFVSYFPQLVAGPINRPQVLLPQLSNMKPLASENIIVGLRLMLWGLFKKVAIADRLAYFVNIVYNDPDSYHGLSVVIATIFFAFQIYCDFSGYSDMAIGVAKTMGVDLVKNFRTPYFSKSIKEFWSRWHISLSTWFRDYVYIPLGGNRVSTSRWALNLFITFMVSGVWHGASWNFVIWGAIHGLLNALEALNSKTHFIRFSLPPLLANIWTFTIVCFAWIFFRANNLHDSFLLINNMFSFDYSFLKEMKGLSGVNLYNLAVGFPLIILLLLLEKSQEFNWAQNLFYSSKPLRYACYISLIVLIAFFGVLVEQSSFIYFQF